MTSFDLLPQVTWLDADGVAAMTSYSKSAVQQKLSRMEGFPKPIRIGGKGDPRWNAAEVDAWMRSQPRERLR